MSIQRARKNNPGNCTHRAWLPSAISRRSQASRLRSGCGPFRLARGDFNAEYAASGSWIPGIPIGQRYVSESVIRCGAPHDPFLRAARANPAGPNDLPLILGIERVQHSGLCAHDQQTASPSKRPQDGRRPDIKVLTAGLRAVRLIGVAPKLKTSSGSNCRDHNGRPVFISKARTASLFEVAGSEMPRPTVPTSIFRQRFSPSASRAPKL